jgi:ABC-type transporter Mla subunit MlaD
MRQASANLNQLIDATGKTLTAIDQAVSQYDQSISAILHEVRAASEKSNLMIQNGNNLIQDGRFHLSTIDRELLKALKNLEITSRNLNRLILQVNEQPSQLFFSEPPQPKPIE